MNKIMTLSVISLLSAASSLASEHKIQETMLGYISPATTHFDLLQADLADKAVQLCGSKQAVRDIKNISIQISSYETNLRLTQVLETKSGNGLNLIYPKFDYSAVVVCAD